MNAIKSVFQDMKENPIQYAAYAVMAIFTYHAIYTFTGNPILAVGGFVLAEGGARFWEKKFRVAENEWQSWVAGLGFILSAIAAVATDAASAAILANEMGIFSFFATVPEWAQITVTFVTVIMATVQILAATSYKWFSDTDKILRQKLKELAAMQVENDNAVKIARANAELEIQKAQVARMQELALENARTEGDKRAQEEFARLISGKAAKTPQPGGDVNFPNGR